MITSEDAEKKLLAKLNIHSWLKKKKKHPAD